MYHNDYNEEMGSVKTTSLITNTHLEMCQDLTKYCKENREYVRQKMVSEKVRKSSSAVAL